MGQRRSLPTVEDYLTASATQLWRMPPPRSEQIKRFPPTILFALAARCLGYSESIANRARREQGALSFQGRRVPIEQITPRHHRCLLADVLAAVAVPPALDMTAADPGLGQSTGSAA